MRLKLKNHAKAARRGAGPKGRAGEGGFTLVETVISFLILMVAGMGAASLFVFAINNNAGTKDRELAMAVAQKRLEWLRNVPYNESTRDVAYHYPDTSNPVGGGLGATAAAGVTETTVSAGRTYSVITVIANNGGSTDANSSVKTITVTVLPAGTRAAIGGVRLVTQRAITTLGAN